MLQDLAGITAGSGGGGESGGILPDAAEWEAIERICILLEKFRCDQNLASLSIARRQKYNFV